MKNHVTIPVSQKSVSITDETSHSEAEVTPVTVVCESDFDASKGALVPSRGW
jgi:hypothetical protein